MISSLRKQVIALTREQRLEKCYLFLWNESLAMQIDLKDLLKKMYEFDKKLLEEKVDEK